MDDTPPDQRAAAPDTFGRLQTDAATATAIGQPDSQRIAPVNEFLVQFSNCVRTITDPWSVARTACQMLAEQLGTDASHWTSIDWESHEYVVEHHFRRPGNESPHMERRYPLDAWEPHTSEFVAGRLLLVHDAACDPRLPQAVRDGMAALGVGASLTIPLMIDGRLAALLAVTHRVARTWGADEVALVQAVAHHCWLEVQRARAEDALRATNERQKVLLRLSDEVRPLSDSLQIQRTAMRVLGEHLGVDRAMYAEISADGERTIVADNYLSGRFPAFIGEYPLSAYGSIFDSLRAGEPMVVDDVDAKPLLTDQERANYKVIGATAFVTIPLIKDGRWVSNLIVHRSQPHHWTAEEVALLQEAAERTWAYVERTRAETALRNSERALRDADRRKDEFLATLAHELRNPLAPVRNGLHILRLGGAHSPRQAPLIDIMERQLNHMVRLVDDLMEASRITRGKIDLQSSTLDLAEVLRSAAETTAPQLQAAQVALHLQLPNDALLVSGDAVRLAQVFANLLGNAAKYTDAGGQVTVALFSEGSEAVVSVRDSGIGIPVEMLPRVFELFTQVDRTLGRSQGGLGIGLALVKNLVGLHGGSVEARSDGPGQGAEFVVRLPLVTAQSQLDNPLPTPSGPQALAGVHVLVVDDNRDAADTLAMMLRLWGADVLTAYDGPSALEAVRGARLHVVLLDLGMPGMDGYAVAEQLRSEPQYQMLKLIALSGWGQPEDLQRTSAAGFDGHWMKPVEPERVIEFLSSEFLSSTSRRE